MLALIFALIFTSVSVASHFGSVNEARRVNWSRGNKFKESKRLWLLRSCTEKSYCLKKNKPTSTNKQTKKRNISMPNKTHVSGIEEVDLAEAAFDLCTKARQCMQTLWETVARGTRWPRPGNQHPEPRGEAQPCVLLCSKEDG